MKRDVLQCETAGNGETTAENERRVSTKSRQSGQKAPHHDAKRREPKKDQAWRAKEAERGRTTQGGLQGARPSQVAKAKGTRDCATSTQRVAPHKAEREIKGHVGDRVSDVVRRVAREFGKEVHNLFGKSLMFRTQVTKSFPRSCALKYLLFLTLHRACIAESALARVCKSFEGAQGLTTVIFSEAWGGNRR